MPPSAVTQSSPMTRLPLALLAKARAGRFTSPHRTVFGDTDRFCGVEATLNWGPWPPARFPSGSPRPSS